MHDSLAVEAFYDSQVQSEWDRANRHPVEFAVTKRLLTRFIGKGRKRILDVGGGPGHYSLWLAEQGHEVTLFDLSGENLRFAALKAEETGLRLADSIQGNVLDLTSRVHGSFDLVLLMGPLYHLTGEGDRRKAIDECLRVLKPEGLLIAAFISCYAPLLDILKRDPGKFSEDPMRYLRYIDNGINSAGEGFTTAFFENPKRVEGFMASCGLEKLGFYTTESIIGPFEPSLKALDAAGFERCIDLAMHFLEDGNCRACGEHFLYVGKRKAG